MTAGEWGIMIGVVTSALLALAPWMFMVHAKLAVLGSQMANLQDKVDRWIEIDQHRASMCTQHEARLDTHEVEIAHIDERLRDIQ